MPDLVPGAQPSPSFSGLPAHPHSHSGRQQGVCFTDEEIESLHVNDQPGKEQGVCFTDEEIESLHVNDQPRINRFRTQTQTLTNLESPL